MSICKPELCAGVVQFSRHVQCPAWPQVAAIVASQYAIKVNVCIPGHTFLFCLLAPASSRFQSTSCSYCLSAINCARLQAVVVRMLSDSKLEVREVAATTLSGLLKGAKADEAARLRASFLADVDRLLPRNRKRQKAKAGADASGALTMDQSRLGFGAEAY